VDPDVVIEQHETTTQPFDIPAAERTFHFVSSFILNRLNSSKSIPAEMKTILEKVEAVFDKSPRNNGMYDS